MSAALEVRDVVVRYGNVVAVDRASMNVPGGAFAALVGPSGCGKTSLLRAIAGFETPAEGSISIGGELAVGPGRFVAPEKRHVGMMFQEGALFPHLTVIENVAFGLRRNERDRAREMLRLVDLETLADRRPFELSGGQQQRVALARALAPSPRIIVLDEPFGGLDAALRVRLREEVRQILRATGTTAMLVTHDQEEALSIADQVSVMYAGRILQTGSPREIYEKPGGREVAALIGDGHLIAARIETGRIPTPFGVLRVNAPDGPCLVRIQTEDLLVTEGSGATGVVVATHFYGHDVVDEVQLDVGQVFRVRLARPSGPAGMRVCVALKNVRLCIFPEKGAPLEATAE